MPEQSLPDPGESDELIMKIFDNFVSKDGKMYVLKQRLDGLFVIEIGGRISSIHSDQQLGEARMKKYREEFAK